MSTFSKFIAQCGPLGVYQLARFLTRLEPKILMYHRFSFEKTPGTTSARAFEAQIAHIKKKYNPMTVTQLAATLEKNISLPKNAVAVTIDDGYQDFYKVAYPILRKYDVPATFYVTTGFIDRQLWLWPDQVSWLIDHSPAQAMTSCIGDIQLTTPLADKEGVWGEIVAYCLRIPDEAKLHLIHSLAQCWGLEVPQIAPDIYAAATWEQLREMELGGIEIGGHTVTHPSLGRVSDEQALSEIEGCKAHLDEHLGVTPRSFCYPNGTPSDYSPELEKVVERASFSAAVVAFADSNGCGNRFALRRHSSGEGRFQFEKAVSGVELLGRRLRA